MFRQILFIFLFVLGTGISFAQKGSYVEFKRFDAEDLGVKEISFQTWDLTGTCWARTELGLLSFDGYNSRLHKHVPTDPNSVVTDTIMRVFQTDSNELWISYENEPIVTRFTPTQNKYEHFDLPLLNESGEFEFPIVKVVKDHLGQIWVLSWGNGKNVDEPSIKDGMDISLCYFNKKDNKIYWAGANNPLWLLRNGELEEIKGDKQPIGKYHDPIPFTSHEKELKANDLLCIFSDGYADQFGGEKGKKFKTKAFKQLLTEVSDKPMTDIQKFIDQSFEEWKGDYEQVDDVCVIGVRF